MDYKIDPRTFASHSAQPKGDKKTRDLKSLRESSREFEALMVMEMLKAMRKSVPEGGLFEKNASTEIFQDMLDTETAKAASRGKGLGLGQAMYDQMAKLIENKK